jgi:beta-aspartyl-peptidase (threonine type)
MERTGHVMLGGDAAEAFAQAQGLALERPEYFHTPFRYEAMLKLRGTNRTALSEDVVVSTKATDGDKSGTVGAVALDSKGALAASTSSGGTTNKMAGRIGQAAIIGAGVYANNRCCAVSCTGQGEAFMRTNAAHELAALMLYRGFPVDRAAQTVIHETLVGIKGRGGLIAVDTAGRVSLPFNTEGMYRGWIGADGRPHTAIYEDVKEWPAL